MRKSLAVAVLAGVVVTACTDDGAEIGFEDLPSPTPSEAAAPSPSASAEAPSPTADEIDVTTTPDEITPEWVTAVVNTLLAEYGEMTAEILAMPVQDDPTLPEGFEERLAELFEGQYLERRTIELVNLQTTESARVDLFPASEIGPLTYAADVVQFAQQRCVVAVGRISQEQTRPDGTIFDVLSAVSLTPNPSPGATNPTRWRLMDQLPNADPDGNPNPDATMLNATLEDYGESLEHTCEAGQ